jgi:hypothetical protein
LAIAAARLTVTDDPALGAQIGLQLLALLGRHHVEHDVHRRHTGHFCDGGRDLPGDLVTHRASRDGEIDADPNVTRRADLDGLDHAQIGDGTADLGVVDGCERRLD